MVVPDAVELVGEDERVAEEGVAEVGVGVCGGARVMTNAVDCCVVVACA